MCVFTVTSPMESCFAISGLWKPSATSRTISRSRGVSALVAGSDIGAVSSRCSEGGSHTSPAVTARRASINVSTANRLKTTARAPARMAANASAAC